MISKPLPGRRFAWPASLVAAGQCRVGQPDAGKPALDNVPAGGRRT